MSAQEELEKLHSDMDATAFLANRVGDHRYSAQLREWADRIAAIREGLGKAQGEARPDGYLHDDGYYTFAEQCRVQMEDKLLHAGSRKIPFFLAPPSDSAQSLEQVAKWAMSEGFATGHAGTMAELLDHLSEQITELRLARDSAQWLVEALKSRFDSLCEKASPVADCGQITGYVFTHEMLDELGEAIEALAAHKSEVKV